jgi:integrase/recombinase XerD
MVTIEIAVKEFMLAQRANGNKPNTIRWYKHMLTPVVVRFYGKPIDRIDVSGLRAYVVDLRSRGHRYVNAAQRPQLDGGLSHESLRDHIRAMKVFFNWCGVEYDLEPNPMNKIRIPGRMQQEPKAIDLDDLKRLLNACDMSTVAGIRDHAMLAFLADTACRAESMLTLRPDKLHLRELYATVLVKGRGVRDLDIPISPYTADLLRKWMTLRPIEADPTRVFCSLAASTAGKPLTYSGLYQSIKRLAKRAGVTGLCNPHSFRHGFAKQYLINGGDLATLSKLMGHKDVSITVEYYTRFVRRELADKHRKFSPITNLEGD